MDKKTKNNLLLVVIGVFLFSALNNFDAVTGYAIRLFSVLFPALLGLALAFLLNIPMSFFARLILRLTGKKYKRAVNALSLILSFGLIIAILFFTGALLAPVLKDSLVGAYGKLLLKLPIWIEELSRHGIDGARLYSLASKIDKNSLFSYIAGGAGNVFDSVWGFVSGAVSGTADIGAAFVIAVYVLLCKESLKRQFKSLFLAVIGSEKTKRLLYLGKIIFDTYSKFFSRQCVEACILSGLMYFSLLIFKIPYAALIGLLCGLCSFVQYLGGAFSCLVGAFLVYLSEPSAVAVFLIVYTVVQFAENQLIYPNVVGASVGLGGAWSVIAAVIGGGAFGVFGMVLAIPSSAVLARLIREKSKEQKKG